MHMPAYTLAGHVKCWYGSCAVRRVIGSSHWRNRSTACTIRPGNKLRTMGRGPRLVEKVGPLKRVTKRALTKTRVTMEDPSVPGDEHLRRVRRLCAALPQTKEKLSHGEPTFFVGKKVYVMFANDHHNDGHVAVWIPVVPGLQVTLLKTEPGKFFMPPYVGVRGWVGIELDAISDEELAAYICEAWRLIAPKKLHAFR
jgi:hypothetical protein